MAIADQMQVARLQLEADANRSLNQVARDLTDVVRERVGVELQSQARRVTARGATLQLTAVTDADHVIDLFDRLLRQLNDYTSLIDSLRGQTV